MRECPCNKESSLDVRHRKESCSGADCGAETGPVCDLTAGLNRVNSICHRFPEMHSELIDRFHSLKQLAM